MAPYIFRYHEEPADSESQIYVYRKRNKRDTSTEPRRKWKYDDSSVYGETVYEYDNESEYTTRSYSPSPERQRNDSRWRRNQRKDFHHHHHHHHHHDHPNDLPHSHHLDGNKKELRNTSPWSEPPLTNGSETQWYEVGPRTHHGGPLTAPRIALLGKRTNRHTHCSCHACPEKSSKNIPSMHYDQLRCPHCAAYAQPTQEEALVYPWTVQSYRPNRRIWVENQQLPDAFTLAGGSAAQRSSQSKPQSMILSAEAQSTIISSKAHSTIPTKRRSPTVGRNSVLSENKENSSVMPLQPLFRYERQRTRSDVTHGGSYSKQTHRQRPRKGQSGMSEVEEASLIDDVQPMDSISNVSLPYSRAPSIRSVNNFKSSPNLRTDATYTRDKYFQSLRGFEPQPALPPPRPAKDTASEISRMLKGEYYDRRTGRTYAYNVNYAPGKIDSVRVPKTTH